MKYELGNIKIEIRVNIEIREWLIRRCVWWI